MIIVLEGRDGVGKTTLARELISQLTPLPETPWRSSRREPGYIHFADRYSHADWIDNEVAADVLVATGPVRRTIIFDRSIISGVAFTGNWLNYRRAVEHAWKWFTRLQEAGHDIALVHLIAPDFLREQRDSDALAHDRRMLYDVDAITKSVGYLLDAHRYMGFDTSELTRGEIARSVITRLQSGL